MKHSQLQDSQINDKIFSQFTNKLNSYLNDNELKNIKKFQNFSEDIKFLVDKLQILLEENYRFKDVIQLLKAELNQNRETLIGMIEESNDFELEKERTEIKKLGKFKQLCEIFIIDKETVQKNYITQKSNYENMLIKEKQYQQFIENQQKDICDIQQKLSSIDDELTAKYTAAINQITSDLLKKENENKEMKNHLAQSLKDYNQIDKKYKECQSLMQEKQHLINELQEKIIHSKKEHDKQIQENLYKYQEELKGVKNMFQVQINDMQGKMQQKIDSLASNVNSLKIDKKNISEQLEKQIKTNFSIKEQFNTQIELQNQKIINLQQNIETKEARVREINQQLNQYEQDALHMTQIVKKFQQEIEEKEQEIIKLNQTIQQIQNNIEFLLSQQQKKFDQILQSQQYDKVQLEKEFEEKVQTITQNLKNEQIQISQQYQKKLDQYMQKHIMEIDRLQIDFERNSHDIRIRCSQLEIDKSNLQNEIQQKISLFESEKIGLKDEISQLKQDWKNEILFMEEKYFKIEEALKKQISKLEDEKKVQIKTYNQMVTKYENEIEEKVQQLVKPFQIKFKDYEEDVQFFSQENKELKKQTKKQEQEITDLKQSLRISESKQQNNARELSQQLGYEFNSSIQNLEQNYNLLNQQVQINIQTLNNKQELIANLEKELEQQENKYIQRQVSIDDQLKKELVKNDEQIKQLAFVQSKLDSFYEQNRALQLANNDLRRQIDDHQFERQIIDLQLKIEQLNKEMKQQQELHEQGIHEMNQQINSHLMDKQSLSQQNEEQQNYLEQVKLQKNIEKNEIIQKYEEKIIGLEKEFQSFSIQCELKLQEKLLEEMDKLKQTDNIKAIDLNGKLQKQIEKQSLEIETYKQLIFIKQESQELQLQFQYEQKLTKKPTKDSKEINYLEIIQKSEKAETPLKPTTIKQQQSSVSNNNSKQLPEQIVDAETFLFQKMQKLSLENLEMKQNLQMISSQHNQQIFALDQQYQNIQQQQQFQINELNKDLENKRQLINTLETQLNNLQQRYLNIKEKSAVLLQIKDSLTEQQQLSRLDDLKVIVTRQHRDMTQKIENLITENEMLQKLISSHPSRMEDLLQVESLLAQNNQLRHELEKSQENQRTANKMLRELDMEFHFFKQNSQAFSRNSKNYKTTNYIDTNFEDDNMTRPQTQQQQQRVNSIARSKSKYDDSSSGFDIKSKKQFIKHRNELDQIEDQEKSQSQLEKSFVGLSEKKPMSANMVTRSKTFQFKKEPSFQPYYLRNNGHLKQQVIPYNQENRMKVRGHALNF